MKKKQYHKNGGDKRLANLLVNAPYGSHQAQGIEHNKKGHCQDYTSINIEFVSNYQTILGKEHYKKHIQTLAQKKYTGLKFCRKNILLRILV